MKKQFIWVLVMVLLAVGSFEGLLAESDSKKPRFYIKFAGTGSLASGGDYDDFVVRREAYYASFSGDPRYTITLSKQPFFRGFGGEIGIEAKKHAVGISAGFLAKKFQVDYNLFVSTTGYEANTLWEHEFSAIPIILFLRYKLVDSRLIKAFFTLGEGVYLATYKENRTKTFVGVEQTFLNSSITARKAHLGFHAGVTLDFNISRNFAISIDAGYRLVKFENIEATAFEEDDDSETTTEGILYYKIYNFNEEDATSEFDIDEFDPPKDNWLDLPAVFNLNGFSITVGLKIIF